MSVNAGNKDWVGFNCFAYAISGKFATLRESLPKSPGFLRHTGCVLDSNASVATNANKLSAKLQEDGLRRHKSTADLQTISGHYLIAAYIDSSLGYHFVRQDFDGNWSHKFGFGNPPESLGSLTHEQLTTASFLNDEESQCHFVGIYSVPDAGLSKDRRSYSKQVSDRPQIIER